jgi:hypothetical protein
MYVIVHGIFSCNVLALLQVMKETILEGENLKGI